MNWDDFMDKARREQGIFRFVKPTYKAVMRFRLPNVRPFWAVVYALARVCRISMNIGLKILYREPMFRYRCERVGQGLMLDGPIPYFAGNGRIRVGDNVRVGGRNTWVVGFKVSRDAALTIGDRVSVNFQTTISVATTVTIGDDTMIAGNVQIYDNISHPLSPSRRRRYESFNLDEAAPIIIGNNVWIGNGASIMRGVTIGDNSVVAAGSIVTRSVPPNVLVAGIPAQVIKSIAETDQPSE